jgi:hypothetical protein
LPALDGTHHGEYSVLMRRVEQGESAMSKTEKPKMPATSDPAAPAPDTEFRYLGEEDVAQLVAEGWTATPAIPGSRDFAFLMHRPAPQTDPPRGDARRLQPHACVVKVLAAASRFQHGGACLRCNRLLPGELERHLHG